LSAALDRCLSEARLNGLALRNRIIKAATFEGMTPGGVPGAAYADFHRRVGAGGAAMTTLAYCGAEDDGRLGPDMMFMDEHLREPLGRVIAAVKETGACVSGQLCHAGGFTKKRPVPGTRPLAPSFGLNTLGIAAGVPFCAAMTTQQIRARVDAFGRAAAFMQSVGFDAIEIHFGHGYGLSQFISPRTNRRSDEYGGSLANRMRFPLQVLAAVRAAVGDTFPLLGKISMSDGVKGGVSYAESLEIAALLDEGSLDCLVPSDGTSSMNPMLLFHGDSLLPGLLENERNPLMRLGLRLMGPRLFREYPWRETYLLQNALRVRERVRRGAVCYIGGVCSAEGIERAMQAGFDFVQVGRALLCDPGFVARLGADAGHRNRCTHCNRCATLIDAPGGIRCVLP
jgi:2,4-dienoyl-CoA reductase-like NADH-dependent reductase (Old Yellow Enzyme family)